VRRLQVDECKYNARDNISLAVHSAQSLGLGWPMRGERMDDILHNG
jgi:hypothetical protein